MDHTEYLKEIGASYEAEAEHQLGRERKSELVKALQRYMNVGFTVYYDNLKVRIKTAYQPVIINGEFKQISGSIKLSQDEVDAKN